MTKMLFDKTIKYNGIVYYPNTEVLVKEEDVDVLKTKHGGWVVSEEASSGESNDVNDEDEGADIEDEDEDEDDDLSEDEDEDDDSDDEEEDDSDDEAEEEVVAPVAPAKKGRGGRR